MTSYDHRVPVVPILPNHYSSWTSKHNMPVGIDLEGENLSCDSISGSKYKDLGCDFSRSKSLLPRFDEVDDPKYKRNTDESECVKQLFETMKYEINRLNSFNGKWPLIFIKPAELTKCGFFYLQSEDEVQCAFCRVIVKEWAIGDKPLKEHMRMYPKCPFLLSSKVGNVPIDDEKRLAGASKCVKNEARLTSSSSYKPKHLRMVDIRNRLMTYKDWPLIMLDSKELAECGLYYTGVADVVTCFFCGGSLGNWELNDDPWVEHKKFFPNCAYLSLIKRRKNRKPESSLPVAVPQQQCSVALPSSSNLSGSLQSEVIRQASDIFPKSLVQKVVLQHLKESSHQFTSLNALCEAILEYKDVKIEPRLSVQESEKNSDIVCSDPEPVKSGSSGAENAKDILLCKICMDQEKGIVFMPCGHLISCPKCAEQIFNCPVCRTPVTNKVRTYLS